MYKAGEDNPADFVSQHPVPFKLDREDKNNIADGYVNFLTTTALPSAITINEVSTARQEDTSLFALHNAIQTGQWANTSALQPYKHIKDEITIDHDNILLQVTRILVPSALQQKVINIAHEGHQRQAKTKACLQESVWFPGMDEAVKNTLEHCLACQANTRPNPPVADRPWQQVKVNFYGPLPSGHYIIVLIDYYSRYPEVDFKVNIRKEHYYQT